MATQPDQVNSGALATMFALTALATLAAALGITALVRSEEAELDLVRNEPITHSFRSLRAEQETLLKSAPAWMDREKGLVSIPIDRAMELTLRDIRSGHTTVGGKKVEEPAADAREGDAAEGEGQTDGPDEKRDPGDDGVGAPPGGAPKAPVTPGKPGTPGESPLNEGDSGQTKPPTGAAPSQGTTPAGTPAPPKATGTEPAKQNPGQGSQTPAEGSDHSAP